MKARILLVIVSTCLSLIFIEAGLRVFNFPTLPPMGWKWQESPYRLWDRQADSQINQLGLRGREIRYSDQDFVVVLLGDSQVEAGTQTFEALPEIVLEGELQTAARNKHIKVFSIAAAGWGQDQQLIWLENYLRNYRADLVLVWVMPVNDYWENAFLDRSVSRRAGRLKPTFRLAENGDLKPYSPFDLDSKLLGLLALAGNRITGRAEYTIEQYYLDRWMRLMPHSASPASPADQCPSNEIPQDHLIEAYQKSAQGFTVVTEEAVAESRSHYSPFLTRLSERDRYLIEVTHALLRRLQHTAEANRAVFKMFHAYRNDLDAAFREIVCVKTQSNGKYFSFDGSDWLRHLKQTDLADHLISFAVADHEAMHVGGNDWHLNGKGNRKVMRELTRILLQQGSVK